MRLRPVDLVDIFVYLVVLGVFIQLFPEVISESFLLALLTAVLLKVVLEGVLFVKKRIVARIRGAQSHWIRVVNVVALLARPSRQQVPRARDRGLGLRRRRDLGGFLQVTALIIVLMLARGGVRRIIDRPAPEAHTD